MPNSLEPCRVEFSRATVVGCAAFSDRVPDGMLYTDQCLKMEPGASGSSTIIASERVPSGTSDQRSGGDLSSPSHVYSIGIGAPSSNAGDENSIDLIAELSGSNSISLESSLAQAIAITESRTSATAEIRSGRIWECRDADFNFKKLIKGDWWVA